MGIKLLEMYLNFDHSSTLQNLGLFYFLLDDFFDLSFLFNFIRITITLDK